MAARPFSSRFEVTGAYGPAPKGFTRSAALALGDLNGDFRNDFTDFGLFKTAFESFNGQGSFAAMLAHVPEPSASRQALVWMAGVTANPLAGRVTYRAEDWWLGR